MRGWVGVVVAMGLSMFALGLAPGVAPARAGGPPALGPPALDQPAFAAAPAALLEAARGVPAGGEAYTVLRHEEDVAADEQGRCTRRIRLVLALRTAEGADAWATAMWTWRPSHEDRPRLRARAVAPSGTAAALDPGDPAQLGDAPQVDEGGATSDRRALVGTLPPLEAGSVIELEIIASERRPVVAAGGVAVVSFAWEGPVASARLSLSAPAARKAKVLSHGLGAPVHRVEGGRESWTFALGPRPPPPALEAHVPGDGEAAPYAALSTAASWSAVARDYRKLTDRRIAEGPAPYPAGVPRAATLDVVRALTAWLHRSIRPTGIGLRQSPVEPRTPAETVRIGAGDAPDRALLLASLLRQAGLRADLALVSGHAGRDIDPEVPGLEGLSRALVRVRAGGRDVWIDPEEPLAQVGQLGPRLRGRRALIAADDTAGLAATPAPASTDSAFREVRTLELAEADGGARVTEVTRAWGAIEAAERRSVRDTPREELAERYTAYMANAYAAAYVHHAATAPEALEVPLEITIEAISARTARTGRQQIEVALRRADVFQRVLPIVSEEDPRAPQRRGDFQWDLPHVYEIEHRLILPPGFTPPALPAGGVTQLGPATLTERYRMDGRTLVAVHRFDSGKPRLAPAELALLRRQIAAVRAEPLRLSIEHTGWALSNAGKVKEAIAEIERLIRLHPTEAAHHIELAQIYVNAGMGAAARRSAQRAIALEPRQADAHVTLGWVLGHDSFGRAHGFDHDRAGALAAYARARELDPTHVGAAAELGDLLLRDARGHRYQPGADLPRALEALRAAHAAGAEEAVSLSFARTLLFTGGLAEARRALEGMGASEPRDAMLVAVIAAGPGGAAEAIRVGDQLRTGSAAATMYQAAASTALFSSRYEAVSALAARARALGATTTLDELGKVLVRGAPPARGRDPQVLAVLAGRLVIDHRDPGAPFWDAQTEAELRGAVPQALPAELAHQPREVLDDLLRTELSNEVTGAATAWRIEIGVPGRPVVFYAALDGGTAKLVGSRESPEGLGRHALRLAARGELAAAAQCLDWVRRDLPGSAAVLGALWGGGAQDRDGIELAAARVAGSSDADRVLAIAARCASPQAGAREGCDQVTASALLGRGRWAELEAHAAAWAGRAAQPDRARALRALGLAQLGRFDEAERELAPLRSGPAPDTLALRVWAGLADERGDPAEAARRYEEVLRRPDAGVSDRNNAAWLVLFSGGELAGGLALARQAVGSDLEQADATALHTLAVLEVEAGELRASYVHGLRAMANGRRAQPEGADWLLLGRLAESLGLRDDAIAAYRRVPPDPARHDSHELARRRLARLGAK